MKQRYLWLAAALMVVVVTVIIAAPNLRDIYAAQKDFVVGSLLSLAGFSVGKALDKSKQERDRWLQEVGAFDCLAKMESTLRSADDRLAEHYWSFPIAPVLLTEAREDLVRGIAYADRMRHALGVEVGGDEWRISPNVKLKLDKIRRDMREALNRLTVSRERLTNVQSASDIDLWDVFDVLTSDLLKANWNLDVLVREHVVVPPEEQARRTANYLHAAARRAGEVRALLTARQVEIPGTFQIMAEDLDAATKGLRELTFDNRWWSSGAGLRVPHEKDLVPLNLGPDPGATATSG